MRKTKENLVLDALTDDFLENTVSKVAERAKVSLATSQKYLDIGARTNALETKRVGNVVLYKKKETPKE